MRFIPKWTHKPLAVLVIGAAMLSPHGCSSQKVATSILSPPLGEATRNEEVVLPMRTCGDYFIADTMINGEGPFPMLLDTGAGTTVISPRVAARINASGSLAEIRIDRFVASGKIPSKVREVDHLSRALGMEIEGILAYGVFKGVLLTYDYPRKQIRVRAGSFDANQLASAEVVPTSTGDRPYVRASADGVDFTVLLDTGSSRSLTLRKLKRFDFIEEPRPTGARMRINGLFVVESGRLANTMQLGPLSLRQPIVHNSVSTNLVGQQILRDFEVTFDQLQHRVRFHRPGEGVETPIEFPPQYGSGLVTAPRDDRLIVRRVFEGSAAENAGIRIDDEILAINGTQIADRGCRHLEFDPKPGPKRTQMKIRRGAEELEIEFHSQVLVP